ncbi:hypothetical protein FCV50_23400, partial [Vibrio kanaloae]
IWSTTPLPREKHIVGKRFTQRIARTNLTLRRRSKRLVRKTIGFPKSEEMHGKFKGRLSNGHSTGDSTDLSH